MAGALPRRGRPSARGPIVAPGALAAPHEHGPGRGHYGAAARPADGVGDRRSTANPPLDGGARACPGRPQSAGPTHAAGAGPPLRILGDGGARTPRREAAGADSARRHRVHGDRRTLVHGAGWEYVHVAVDDYRRVAYVEVLPDQRGQTTARFLRR